MDRLTMEVEFKREMNRNYMVMLPEMDRNERYAVRMFTDNQIPGFLPFHEKRINGETRYYYDITSKQPLRRILECRNLTGEELEQLISALLFSLKQVERFLLNESCIFLEPDYIYIEPDSFKCFLCYIPGKWMDFSQNLCELSQYLLDHVNHRDGEAVVLAFSFFKECRKENFGMEDIERCLEKRARNGTAEKRTTGKGTTGKESEDVPKGGGRERAASGWSAGGQREAEEYGIRSKTEDDFESGVFIGAEDEEKDIVQYQEKNTGKRGRIHILNIGFILGMAALPVSVVILWGFQGLFQYKWILGALEVILGTILFVTSSGTKGTNPPDNEIEQKREPWEVYFREENDIEEPEEEAEAFFQMEDEEIQTVLLTARPVTQECRRLVSVTGNLEIPIGYFPFLIGKNKEMADFCLNEPGVSRLHAKIEKSNEGYSITDLNSTNGTWVNGQLLEANETCALPLDSEVEIASRRFWFR